MWVTILKLLASIAAYLSNKQLVDAGRAIEKDKQEEANKNAIQTTKDIKKANSALSDDDIVVRLQGYTRK